MRILAGLIAATGGLMLAGTAMAFPPRDAVLVPAGEPVNCVQTPQIRSTRVVDDKTIDFDMGGGRILRNTLPHSCPSLGFEKAFAYSTSIARLCNVDIITVIRQGGGPMRGASCGLGVFQPVKVQAEKPEAAPEAKPVEAAKRP